MKWSWLVRILHLKRSLDDELGAQQDDMQAFALKTLL
jgi:hypothetical protein